MFEALKIYADLQLESKDSSLHDLLNDNQNNNSQNSQNDDAQNDQNDVEIDYE